MVNYPYRDISFGERNGKRTMEHGLGVIAPRQGFRLRQGRLL